MAIVSTAILSKWATDQAHLIEKTALNDDMQLDCSSIIRRCAGQTEKLTIAYYKGEAICYQELKDIIISSSLNQVITRLIFSVERDRNDI